MKSSFHFSKDPKSSSIFLTISPLGFPSPPNMVGKKSSCNNLPFALKVSCLFNSPNSLYVAAALDLSAVFNFSIISFHLFTYP
jgi:hypothetical protein